MTPARLGTIAARYSHALRAVQFTATHGNLANFPKECCHHASYLFAIHILKCHNEEATVVFAKRGEASERRHVWVSLRGTIVDLTSGQFTDESLPEYYVGSATGWYSTWAVIASETLPMTAERADRLLNGFYGEPFRLIEGFLATTPLEVGKWMLL
jgi:hypothetical protein